MGIVSSVAELGGLPRVLQGWGLCAAAVGPGPDGPEPPGLGGFWGAEVPTGASGGAGPREGLACCSITFNI